MDVLMDDSTGAFQATKGTVAQLGISIEPMVDVQKQADAYMQERASMALVKAAGSTQDMGVKLIESFYNYCTSFATTLLPQDANILFQMPGLNLQNTFIPLKAVQDWYKHIMKKAEGDNTLFKDADISMT